MNLRFFLLHHRLPPEIGMLTKLRDMAITDNPHLTGPVSRAADSQPVVRYYQGYDLP